MNTFQPSWGVPNCSLCLPAICYSLWFVIWAKQLLFFLLSKQMLETSSAGILRTLNNKHWAADVSVRAWLPLFKFKFKFKFRYSYGTQVFSKNSAFFEHSCLANKVFREGWMQQISGDSHQCCQLCLLVFICLQVLGESCMRSCKYPQSTTVSSGYLNLFFFSSAKKGNHISTKTLREVFSVYLTFIFNLHLSQNTHA